MFGAILKATNSSFQKGITFCRSIYLQKVMKLLAFIFEQPSYGDKDCDGFYKGESGGRIGFIPCNMVSEILSKYILLHVYDGFVGIW